MFYLYQGHYPRQGEIEMVWIKVYDHPKKLRHLLNSIEEILENPHIPSMEFRISTKDKL